MNFEFSRQTLNKCSSTKFHENPSSVSRFGPRGRMDRHDIMTKPVVAFGNFVNAPRDRRTSSQTNVIFMELTALF